MVKTRRYVVTNYRFDETFKIALYKALANQQAIEFMCEEAISLTTVKETIYMIPHQVSNADHIFDCIGSSDGSVCRLEEISGTLYLKLF